MSRRRLVGGLAAGALAVPAVGGIPLRVVAAAPRARSALSPIPDARRHGQIPGRNWLYFDPAKLYEINPASGFQVIYECLYHIPNGTRSATSSLSSRRRCPQ